MLFGSAGAIATVNSSSWLEGSVLACFFDFLRRVRTGLTGAIVAGNSLSSLSRKVKRLKVGSVKKSNINVAKSNLLWRFLRDTAGTAGRPGSAMG